MAFGIESFKSDVVVGEEPSTLVVHVRENTISFLLNDKEVFVADWKGNLRERFSWLLKHAPKR